LDRGRDLQAIADYPGVVHQDLDFAPVVASNLLRVEVVKRGAIVLALLKDGVPAQARLRAFEDEELEKRGVIVVGGAPLFIMVADG